MTTNSSFLSRILDGNPEDADFILSPSSSACSEEDIRGGGKIAEAMQGIETMVKGHSRIWLSTKAVSNIKASTAGFSPFLTENILLRKEIDEIKQRMTELENRMPMEKVIVLREVPRSEAKEEIRQLFSSGRTLYYSDIAEELKLDLELVVDLCQELQESGKISADGSIL
jgi:regulator of replication initiation timing